MLVPSTLNKLRSSSFQIQVGIPIFCIGGIGGVHRHGEQFVAYLFCYILTRVGSHCIVAAIYINSLHMGNQLTNSKSQIVKLIKYKYINI
jgi:pseudouridine-5'-phosphate glycosidase